MVVLVAFGSAHLAVPIVVGLERPSVSMGSSQTGSTFGNIDCIWIVDSIDSVAINESRSNCVVSITVGLVGLSVWVSVTLVFLSSISIVAGL